MKDNKLFKNKELKINYSLIPIIIYSLLLFYFKNNKYFF
jgi:hypothetical protein